MGGRIGGVPVVLLTTTGRKTGKRRITPLVYLADGEDLVVVGSAGGFKDPFYIGVEPAREPGGRGASRRQKDAGSRRGRQGRGV